MFRTTSEPGKAFLEKREGFSATAYPDAAGYSIGFGTYLGHEKAPGPLWAKYRHATIGVGEARGLMQKKLYQIEADINRLVKVPLEQHEFDALVSFCYNVGTGEKGFAGSTLLRRLNENRRALAADQFLRWRYALGKEEPGLVARREGERLLFLGDKTLYSK
jgi:lysozyme